MYIHIIANARYFEAKHWQLTTPQINHLKRAIETSIANQ